MRSSGTITTALSKTAMILKQLNASANVPGFQNVIMEFEMQTQMMDSKAEMVDEAIDDGLEEAGDESTADDEINKVLDEILVKQQQSVSVGLVFE
jgi:division protein CdvB (Snf7/Vps24/ESCRT-III family)